MNTVLPMRNPIRHYAWGSRTALARLQGRPHPTAEPEAELWMGAHPSAPSEVWIDGRWRPLPEVIAERPVEMLGEAVVERFGARLPFLFKVLAVERPLSIQAHPDAAQARAGFARENAAGIPLDAPERCYRDGSHKPELVCALEAFEALRGFRPPAEIAALLERLGAEAAGPLVEPLREADEAAALRAFTERLLRMGPEEAAARVGAVGPAAAARSGEDPAFAWIARLAADHPADPGVLAPAFLRYVRLAPGEALFLPAGELHCYLRGTALEVMANSDNVLRGGLTPKHVDVDELLRVVRFDVGEAGVVQAPLGDAPTVFAYPCPASEFVLRGSMPQSGRAASWGRQGGILFNPGPAPREISYPKTRATVAVAPGESVFLRPGTTPLRIEPGSALFLASSA